jgi:hypothetical protein
VEFSSVNFAIPGRRHLPPAIAAPACPADTRAANTATLLNPTVARNHANIFWRTQCWRNKPATIPVKAVKAIPASQQM